MKAIKFKGFNQTFGLNSKVFPPMPAYQSKEGEVVTCWQMSFAQKLLILFTGKVWVHTITQNANLQYFILTPIRPFKRRKSGIKTNVSRGTKGN